MQIKCICFLGKVSESGAGESELFNQTHFLFTDFVCNKSSRHAQVRINDTELYATFSAIGDSSLIQEWLQNAIDTLIRADISKAELALAHGKEREMINEKMEELGFIWSRTELLGEGLLFKGDPDYYHYRFLKQKELTPSDLRKNTEKWLMKKPFRLLIVSRTQADP